MSPGGPGEPAPFPFDGDSGREPPGEAGFFRGSELPKLLVLVAILVIGCGLFWNYWNYVESQPEPEPAIPEVPAKVVPETGPEFETVTDRTPVSFRDMAAYELLVKRARETSAADLARQSRRDVFFTDLWERPARYRGVAIHLLGTALRIHTLESNLSPKGCRYEAWVTTHESQGHPYVCVFEDLPPGLPVGPAVSERVVFNGYFLKQMSYLAGRDIPRGAPVLIGRIGWTPGPKAAKRDYKYLWLALIVALLFVVSLARWLAGFRRWDSPRARSTAARLSRRPTDEIDPADLARWVESVREEESEPEQDEPQGG
jgi:hypothetical protein